MVALDRQRWEPLDSLRFRMIFEPETASATAIKPGIAVLVEDAAGALAQYYSARLASGDRDKMVAAAKEKPGSLTFASAGIGSSSHMAAERFRLVAKIDVRHIPFKEGGLVQVMAGNIDFYFIPLAAAASALNNDKLVVLAVSSPKRVPRKSPPQPQRFVFLN